MADWCGLVPTPWAWKYGMQHLFLWTTLPVFCIYCDWQWINFVRLVDRRRLMADPEGLRDPWPWGIRIKVSNSSADVSETAGIQFIRSPNVSATGASNNYPFSIVKVFTTTGAGTYNYFLNMLHQVGSGTAAAQTDDTTFTALYVPNTLP